MIFNSIDFSIFLPIVFIIYWLIPSEQYKIQNSWLVIASYVFYGWWDYRFLSLIFISSVVDYLVSRSIESTIKTARKRLLLYVSLTVNLSLLFFFKYYNFFIESLVDAYTLFGVTLDVWTLNIILPVGISFYTFQTLSYSIDVYRGKIKPTKDFVAFSSYVSFFPQLVAGPIERASRLLPQFERSRTFDSQLAIDGCRQILWGLVKKVVIADRCAEFVNIIFENPAEQSGSTLALGAMLFAFQIYGDFSGYSDMAIGISKLFGFRLSQNFSYPYFSRDIAEFWRS